MRGNRLPRSTNDHQPSSLSRRELVLIINLGGFLGAMIGGIMLTLESLPAGLLATAVFVVLSLIFINAKA